MGEILSKCGYRCDLCAAYETNLRGEADKQDMCRALQTYYGFADFKPEYVKPCKGCAAAKETPDPNCEVFPCVKDKDLDNCGQCEKFENCDTLKTRMDIVEETLAKFPDMPQRDYERYFEPYLSREALSRIRDEYDG